MHKLIGGPVTAELENVAHKIEAGGRIGLPDCLTLWKTHDLTGLAALANARKEQVSGNSCFFQTAAFLNYGKSPVPAYPESNVHPQDGLPLDKVPTHGVRVLYLVGPPDSRADTQQLCELITRARSQCPGLPVRAFTWDALEIAAHNDGQSPSEVLRALSSAGLSSLAGGALVDLTPESPHLFSGAGGKVSRRIPWIAAAVEAGLTCELSWIYGEEDDPEAVTGLLDCIRGLQDRFHVFDCLAPLPFSPGRESAIAMPTGYNYLRAVAVSRLYLNNIPRIRSSPSVLGESLAQVAQWYGADDAGLAIPDEHSPEAVRALTDLIRAAGRDPVPIAGPITR